MVKLEVLLQHMPVESHEMLENQSSVSWQRFKVDIFRIQVRCIIT
jgi:hypothetical protein